MDVFSRKAQASSMVKGNEVGMEKSESEGCLYVSEGLVMGVVIEVVQGPKIYCEMVVMVVDSTKVGLGNGIMTKIDGMKVVVVSEELEDFGGGGYTSKRNV